MDASKNDSANNSFTLGLKPTDKDFLSLDEKELLQPRQSDGAFPAVTFMHLTEGSALIDSGVDVGLPFHGAKPDLGAFER
jgi:pectate lyase